MKPLESTPSFKFFNGNSHCISWCWTLHNLDSHRGEYRCTFRSQTNPHTRYQAARKSKMIIGHAAKTGVLLMKEDFDGSCHSYKAEESGKGSLMALA
ncbi:hypothetical protein F2Q70_00043879 [Brassica cretica]|uniref:Uncharacterized protein n=1 Tax=Brassica cretica TaxID=69181 RepID=A0A8S9KFS5_BRACR|nr:hypothetical protein F2Q70_00043879 [Brassica cretica]